MSRANPPVDLTPDLWIIKLLLGAIDRSYDSKEVMDAYMASPDRAAYANLCRILTIGRRRAPFQQRQLDRDAMRPLEAKAPWAGKSRKSVVQASLLRVRQTGAGDGPDPAITSSGGARRAALDEGWEVETEATGATELDQGQQR